MLDTYFHLYQDVQKARQDRYDAALYLGNLQPFVYPRETISVAILLLAVLFIPRLSVTRKIQRAVSISAFAAIVYFCVSTMRRCRTLGMAGGYGIGLMCVWGMVASAYLLVFNDIGTSFRRVERRNIATKSKSTSNQPEQVNGSVMPERRYEQTSSNSSLKNRKVWGVNSPDKTIPVDDDQGETQDPAYELVWQAHPSPFRHRLDWTIDLVTSFRGVNWNFRIPSLPAADFPPKDVTSASSADSVLSSPLDTMHRLRHRAIQDSVFQYLILDLFKAITITDPYFHGTASLESPSPWPILADHPALTRFTRLSISITSVLAALTFIFSLSPLFFPFLPTSLTNAPLHEPFLYPPYWGALAPSLLDKGLPGLWGKWWHQMFRFGISEPSRLLITAFGLDPKGQTARVLSVLIAFTISGSIHAGASYTTFLDSRPLSGPLLFFMLQGIGVLCQTFFTQQFSHKVYDTKTLPSWVRRTGNGLFVLTWLWFTGPLLANDFARCGIWLFEPLPVSPLRGLLGWGWWCWNGPWIMVWTGRQGDPWWSKGIAIL